MERKKLSRRSFLRISTVAGAGIALMPTNIVAATQESKEKPTIPVRTLGRTGVQLPILGIGVDRPDSNNVLRAAYNSGIMHIDTANAYQNGKNEEMIGTVLKGKPRDSAFVSTKIYFNYPLSDNFEADFNTKLEASLKRLSMDYVDGLYIHMAKLEQLQDPRVLAVMSKAKADGKARFLGISSHDNNPEIIDATIAAGIYDIALISYNFKLANREEIEAAIERGVKAGLGFITMKAMAGGTEDKEGKKKINAKACLRWVWQNENITTVIPGLFNYDQLDECLEAVYSPVLTAEDRAYIEELSAREMLYCQQCKQCVGQCVQQLPIPDIMRAHMYAYGYKHAKQSKETLASLNLPTDVCANCDSCTVTCPSGFDVAGKIAAVMPVAQVPDVFLT